jgi:hypothetical protein
MTGTSRRTGGPRPRRRTKALSSVIPTEMGEDETSLTKRHGLGRPLEGQGESTPPSSHIEDAGETTPGRHPLTLVRPDRSAFVSLYEMERHRGSLEILLVLYTQGGATRSGLRQRLKPGPEALEASLQSLLRLGLVDFELRRSFPFGRQYRLTSRVQSLMCVP